MTENKPFLMHFSRKGHKIENDMEKVARVVSGLVGVALLAFAAGFGFKTGTKSGVKI